MYQIPHHGRSLSSIESLSTNATIQRRKFRSFSTSSLSSTNSYFGSRVRNDSSSRRASLSTMLTPGRQVEESCEAEPLRGTLADVEETECDRSSTDDIECAEDTVVWHQLDPGEDVGNAAADFESIDDATDPTELRPFRRWISTLRRKKKQAPVTVTPRNQRWTLDDFESTRASPLKQRPSRHHKSISCASSSGFVTAVKSATATIATASIATVSRRNSRLRRGQQHSSLFSGSEHRPSMETQRFVIDEASRQRSRRRREKVVELVQTEEGYVADLKALSNALFTVYGHISHSQSYMRHCASTTLSQLIAVHHTLLDDLRRVVPFADNTPIIPASRRHTRWYSVDGTPPTRKKLNSVRRERRSLNLRRSSSAHDDSSLLCEPRVVLAVANVFEKHVASFSAYDSFGEHYELLRFGIDQAQQSNAGWSEYDAAFETLAHTLNPMHSRDANRRKALTVKDLLIKPIQRLPRYLLLLNDLRKLTPVCDDPVVHEGMGPVIEALEMACEQVNRSRQSLDTKRALEATWLVSHRLSFHNQLPRSAFLKLLGQVTLCGCLHIAYRTKDAVRGRYAVCVLFETTLLLAAVDEDDYKYSVLAGIALANATIAEADNGRGLQCHTAPHSWKIVYEHQTKMYEVLFTACSAVEASLWREKTVTTAALQAKAALDGNRGTFELYSPLVEEMKTVGKAIGNAGSFVRRMSRESIRRAATVASTTNLSQVIIKNTQACKEALDNSSKATLQLPRSQSVATPSHVQTLAPRRAERMRLQTLLSDVWTKNVLPYPGMTPRRSDPIRASANHVMRKLSMASIASNFSTAKRNVSYTSIASCRKEDLPPVIRPRRHTEKERAKPTRPPLVDFHNAPEAFLPEDFDLRGTTGRTRSALRTFTMTLERPFSPMVNENKPADLRRTQSVRDAVPGIPVYSVVQQRATTPALNASMNEHAASDVVDGSSKTPRKMKSKNRLLRLFA